MVVWNCVDKARSVSCFVVIRIHVLNFHARLLNSRVLISCVSPSLPPLLPQLRHPLLLIFLWLSSEEPRLQNQNTGLYLKWDPLCDFGHVHSPR